MNILHIGPKNIPPNYGGIEKVVSDLMNGIFEFNSFVFVLWQQKENQKIKIFPKGFLKQIKTIGGFVKENNISIIHYHKTILVFHAIITSLLGIKSVITFHGCSWRVNKWPIHVRIILYFLNLLACVLVPNAVFVSKRDYKHFSRIVFWKKLYFISNGIELSKEICTNNTRKCVFIGRLSLEKNLINLINMFIENEKELTLYGPFDEKKKKFKRDIIYLINNHKNIHYGGVLDSKNVINTLVKYNTFLNISFSEGMPVAVLEAASVGMNLVLSDIPQHRDLSFPEAYYVNPESPVMDFSFNGNSLKNKVHFENNYLISNTIDKYRHLYLKMLDQGN